MFCILYGRFTKLFHFHLFQLVSHIHAHIKFHSISFGHPQWHHKACQAHYVRSCHIILHILYFILRSLFMLIYFSCSFCVFKGKSHNEGYYLWATVVTF